MKGISGRAYGSSYEREFEGPCPSSDKSETVPNTQLIFINRNLVVDIRLPRGFHKPKHPRTYGIRC